MRRGVLRLKSSHRQFAHPPARRSHVLRAHAVCWEPGSGAILPAFKASSGSFQPCALEQVTALNVRVLQPLTGDANSARSHVVMSSGSEPEPVLISLGQQD